MHCGGCGDGSRGLLAALDALVLRVAGGPKDPHHVRGHERAHGKELCHKGGQGATEGPTDRRADGELPTPPGSLQEQGSPGVADCDAGGAEAVGAPQRAGQDQASGGSTGLSL